MKQIRSTLLILSAALLVCQSASAYVWRSSQIVGYNTGDVGVDAGTGTLDGWARINGPALVTVTNGSGSLIGTNLGLVASAGDRIFINFTNRLDATRNQFVPASTFPMATVETNIYYSFLYKFNNTDDIPADGEVIIRLNTGNSGALTAQHWDLVAKNVANKIQLGIAKAGAPSNVTNYASTNISAGQTIFVVVKQQLIIGAQNDVYTLWINPPPKFFGTNEVDIPPWDAIVGTNTTDGTETVGSGPGRFVITSGANAEFDEFRVASTWADATPWFGQCVAASIAVSPTNQTVTAETTTTFSTITIGTSETYQWQVSTNGGTNYNNVADGDTSLYRTPVLALSDNGNRYRAIVTVSCNGSTATSAPATLTITAPVVTPVGLVVHDLFDDQRDTTPFGISNSVWYTAAAASANLSAPAGDLVGTPLSGSSSLWVGYFTDAVTNRPVHLAVGTGIKVTLPFTPTAFTSFTNNAGLRMGLFDYADGGVRFTNDSANATGSGGQGTQVTGYMMNLDFGPTFSVNSPLQLLVRQNLGSANLMGTVGDFLSLQSGPAGGGYTNSPAFQAGTQYILVFTVARTGTSSVDVTAAITGGGTNWTYSVTETNAAYHRFDSFAIRPNSLETSADSFTFPEFKVEVIQAVIPVLPFNITSIQRLSATDIKVTWDSVSGVNYQIQSRDALNTGNWATNATVLATGTSTSYTNTPITATQHFYRVVATP